MSLVCLGFINETAKAWQCASKVELVNGMLVGHTSHFTDFAVLIGQVEAPHVNTITTDDITNLKNITKSTIAACIFKILFRIVEAKGSLIACEMCLRELYSFIWCC